MLACSRCWVAGTWGRLISANIDRESLLEASTFSSQWVVTWRLGHGGLSRGPRLAFLLLESGTVIYGTSAPAVWHDRSGSDRGGRKGPGPDSKVHRISELHWNNTPTDHQIHRFVAKKSKPVFLLLSPYRTDDRRSSV
jgi:hypothetical protein